ncbi:hypothetical protein BD309DRAFT_1021862 [Dichomitus squalens]|nr:hypothetical protein BD309DRAFT_1021862 [Dichomitus squalens]
MPTKPPAAPAPGGTPRVSAALIHGAQQLSDIFERRTAVLKAHYEERIRAITAERDILLAATQTQARDTGPHPDASELEALRAERLTWLQERAQHEQQRKLWEQERQSWALERAKLGEERVARDAERVQREETVARLTHERDLVLQEREQRHKAHQDLLDEMASLRHELQVNKSGYGALQEQLALRNSSMLALETRVRQLEAERSGFSGHAGSPTEANAPVAPPHDDADGVEGQQTTFDPLDFTRSPLHSPARSSTLLTTEGTMSTLESHSPHPTPMQVCSPPLVPFPFDSTLNLSPTFSRSLPPLQLDAPVPQSSTITLRLDTPSSPAKSTIGGSVHGDVFMDDAAAGPVSVSGSSSSFRSRSSTSVVATPSRRLVIRIPLSNGNIRKPLKPLPPRFTEEEKLDVVHVPRLPESDDDDDGTDTASSDDESVEGF